MYFCYCFFKYKLINGFKRGKKERERERIIPINKNRKKKKREQY